MKGGRVAQRARELHPNWPVRFVVEYALADCGSVPKAAAALGVSPNTLRAWVKENGYVIDISPLILLKKAGGS